MNNTTQQTTPKNSSLRAVTPCGVQNHGLHTVLSGTALRGDLQAKAHHCFDSDSYLQLMAEAVTTVGKQSNQCKKFEYTEFEWNQRLVAMLLAMAMILSMSVWVGSRVRNAAMGMMGQQVERLEKAGSE